MYQEIISNYKTSGVLLNSTPLDSEINSENVEYYYNIWSNIGYGYRKPQELIKFKQKLIDYFINIAKENGYNYGFSYDLQIRGYPYLIYIDLPQGQISFHNDNIPESYGTPFINSSIYKLFEKRKVSGIYTKLVNGYNKKLEKYRKLIEKDKKILTSKRFIKIQSKRKNIKDDIELLELEKCNHNRCLLFFDSHSAKRCKEIILFYLGKKCKNRKECHSLVGNLKIEIDKEIKRIDRKIKKLNKEHDILVKKVLKIYAKLDDLNNKRRSISKKINYYSDIDSAVSNNYSRLSLRNYIIIGENIFKKYRGEWSGEYNSKQIILRYLDERN